MALDHGILNIPLSKRGSIDAQLDRYKADVARAAKADRKAEAEKTAAARIKAKVMVAAITPERMEQLALRCKASVPATRKYLKSEAHWQPEFVLRLLAA